MLNFLEKFWRKEMPESPPADFRLGRFSDIYKSPEQYEAWDRSLSEFGKRNYLDAYESFMHYLADAQEDNLTYTRETDRIQFSFFQGSKRVSGTANLHQVKATVTIAHYSQEDVALLRRLLERNFDLQYARYGLLPKEPGTGQDIALIFDTYTLDGSPYKLYYALKELSTHADKHDDLLLEEFPDLQPIEPCRIELSEAEKTTKVRFLRSAIQATFREIQNGTLNQEKYPGAMVYLLLALAYKLDFLLKPEGFVQDILEKVHRIYFSKQTTSMADKQRAIEKEFSKITDRSDEAIKSELYRVKATFGITTPIDHERMVALLDAELGQMLWYRDNGHHAIALAIMQYVVGHILFNFAPAAPARACLQFFWQIFENDFFAERGIPGQFYDQTTDSFFPKNIKAHLEKLEAHFSATHPTLSLDASRLNYTNKVAFAESYLLMVRELPL